MDERVRPAELGWGVWLLLVGMTMLGSLWTRQGSPSDAALPMLDSSELGPFSDPEDGALFAPQNPPKIVFPAVDEDDVRDGSSTEIKR
jgi:hypothetical protein